MHLWMSAAYDIVHYIIVYGVGIHIFELKGKKNKPLKDTK